MNTNQYDGALDGWKNSLIIGRARRAGLRGDLLLEVQQELVLHVAAFEHQDDRANGATEATALTAVIDRQLKAFQRAHARSTSRQDRARRLHVRHENERSDLDQRLLAVDVRRAIEQLTPEEQQVCALLGEGKSVRSIAKTFQCHWQTVQRVIERVRGKFHAQGLDGWVCDR